MNFLFLFLHFFILKISWASPAIQFTSKYYDPKAECKCARKLNPPDKDGEDVCGDQFVCNNFEGYSVKPEEGHGCLQETLEFRKPPNFYISLLDEGRKIEWRYADGKPFAIIFRETPVSELCRDNVEQDRPKQEQLTIKGLIDFREINNRVLIKEKNANIKARELADQAYLKTRKKLK